jgi:hypothetical protein
MYSNSSYESTAKWETSRIFRGRLAGASVTKTATLFGVSIAAVPIVMTAYTNHRKTLSATRISGRKPKLIERDRRTLKRIVSKNDRTTAAKVTPELNIHPADPVRREPHKTNIHSRNTMAKPLITENNAKRRKGWCDDHKTWTSNDWMYVIWSDESSSRCSQHTAGFMFGERPRKPTFLSAWFQLWEVEADLWQFGQQYLVFLLDLQLL